MKINLSEFWAKERKHDGKMKQDIYLEKFLLFFPNITRVRKMKRAGHAVECWK